MFFLIAILAVVGGLVVATIPTIIAINAALVVFFMAANVLKLVLIKQALDHPSKLTVDMTTEPIADADLPMYTILLPVYREANMLPQLVAGIEALDYPEDRLDVKLLLEADDGDTLDAVSTLIFPTASRYWSCQMSVRPESREPAIMDWPTPAASIWSS